jgi:hypothetical protein
MSALYLFVCMGPGIGLGHINLGPYRQERLPPRSYLHQSKFMVRGQ